MEQVLLLLPFIHLFLFILYIYIYKSLSIIESEITKQNGNILRKIKQYKDLILYLYKTIYK